MKNLNEKAIKKGLRKAEKKQRRKFKKKSIQKQVEYVSTMKRAVKVLQMFSYRMDEDGMNYYLHPFKSEVLELIEEYMDNLELFKRKEVFILGAAIRTFEQHHMKYQYEDILDKNIKG